MNKLLLSLFVTLGFSVTTFAAPNTDANVKPLSEAVVKKMDRKMTKHKAQKRDFRTQKEFKRHQKRQNRANYNRNGSHNKIQRHQDYNNGYNYNRDNYKADYRPIRQRGYRHSKRGWLLAYRYDRAAFYDNQGYYYGFFNRYGYYFEGTFYRYDRYYTYRDRSKGRGLFDRRYYMPINADYYGFAKTRHYDDNRYERGYDRY